MFDVTTREKEVERSARGARNTAGRALSCNEFPLLLAWGQMSKEFAKSPPTADNSEEPSSNMGGGGGWVTPTQNTMRPNARQLQGRVHANEPKQATLEIEGSTVFKLTIPSVVTGFGCSIQTHDLIADGQPRNSVTFQAMPTVARVSAFTSGGTCNSPRHIPPTGAYGSERKRGGRDSRQTQT